MTPVIRLGVDAIDVAHQPRQVGAPGMQNQVVMIVHQAIGQGTGIKPLKRRADRLQKHLPVRVIVEYRFTSIPTRGDVVNRTGKLYAQGTGQGSSWAGRRQKARPDPLFSLVFSGVAGFDGAVAIGK